MATRVLRADDAAIADAARVLAAGGLVAFPTETVYGLGADATNGEAVARLYAAKGRPSFNPLIAHVLDLAAARTLAQFRRRRGAPGASVLAGTADAGVAQSAGLPGGRPRDGRARHHCACACPIIRWRETSWPRFGRPVVAPSANRSGHVSPTTAAHVLADLDGRIDLIIDGGATPVGVESTIVACLGAPALLRPGRPAARGDRTRARPAARRTAGHAMAPTMRRSRPACSPRIMRRARRCGSTPTQRRARRSAAGLRPGACRTARSAPPQVLNLSARGDVIEAAANLFSYLRALDAAGATTIAVMPVPHDDLGEAINDRLQRAAAPR